jgi:hypothetical protein
MKKEIFEDAPSVPLIAVSEVGNRKKATLKLVQDLGKDAFPEPGAALSVPRTTKTSTYPWSPKNLSATNRRRRSRLSASTPTKTAECIA